MTCNNMEKIWKSNFERDFKIRIFRATIEPVLLYGSETWTLSAKQQRLLDGCYTRLLHRVPNLSWKNHPTLETIYGCKANRSAGGEEKTLYILIICNSVFEVCSN